jgi:deoxycytidylate deaminase
MNPGDEFRRLAQDKAAVALLGLTDVRSKRAEQQKHLQEDDAVLVPLPGFAFIFHSLKHEAEVKELRRIYGESFHLVSVYSRAQQRRENLVQRILRSHRSCKYPAAKAQYLMERDEIDAANPYGQNVQDTFPLGDVFINADDPAAAEASINRFIELLFGNTFHTPTKDEYCMCLAHAASLRSADLGRQVGAVIASTAGDIISVGTNEVPKAGGGSYWCDEPADARDFRRGFDANSQQKVDLLRDLMSRLSEGGWLTKSTEEINSFVSEVFGESPPNFMKGSDLFDLIGAYRAVHGETAALLDAARRGVSVAGKTVYVTDFPCHECARHIIAGGIKRVVYVQPYPKSLAFSQYPEALALDVAEADDERVVMQSFVGIAPRQYNNLFSKLSRKRKDGTVKKWIAADASPRYSLSQRAYIVAETFALGRINHIIDQ